MLLAFFVMDVIKINVEIGKVWFGQIAEVVRKISGKDKDDEDENADDHEGEDSTLDEDIDETECFAFLHEECQVHWDKDSQLTTGTSP